MNRKTARRLRKLINLNYKEREETQLMVVGSKKVGVIDGIKDELRVEDRDSYQGFADKNIQIYRKLKKEYNKFSDLSKEIKKDLKKLTQKGGINE